MSLKNIEIKKGNLYSIINGKNNSAKEIYKIVKNFKALKKRLLLL